MISQEPAFRHYWHHASYKDKIRAEGQAFTGTWRIHYIAANGEMTIRTVMISHFLARNESGHILGLCKLRGEERAFSFGGIQRAYDLESCTLIEDPLRYISQTHHANSTAALKESIRALLRTGWEFVETMKEIRKSNRIQNKARKLARPKR